jgi:hypothetical protein
MRLALLVFLLLPWPVHAMPPAFFVAIGFSVAAAEMASIAVTIASIALTIGTTVYGAVAQKAAAKKAKRKAAQARQDFLNSLQDRTITRIVTDAPIRYVYGRARVGSDIVGLLSSGDIDQYRHLVCVHAGHECDGIEEIYIDGKALGPLDADGYVTTGDYFAASTTENITETFSTSPFTLQHTPSSAVKVIAYSASSSTVYSFGRKSAEVAYTRSGNTITVTGTTSFAVSYYSVTYQYSVGNAQVRVKIHLGEPGQTADASLLAECPDKWASTATLTGLCYTVIRLDLRQEKFQGGIPEIQVLLRGKKLYDLRDGTTAWSQNPALAIYDYLTSEMCGVDASDIPAAHVITAANVCDEPQSFGPLYTCNGTVTADQDQANVLDAMADSMAGGIVSTTWEMFAGKYVAPIASLSQSDIVGALAVTPGISDADIINGVRGQNITAENLYVATDYEPYQNVTYREADGRDKYAPVDYPFTDTKQRVHNLARIMVEDMRNGFTVKAEFSLKAWDLRVGDRLTFTSAFLGQTDKVYRITDKKYAPDSSVELTMKEDAASIWDLADTVTLDDTPNTDLPDPFVVEKLGYVTCNSGTAQLLMQGDGTIVSRILVTWGAATGEAAFSGLVEIEWKKDSDSVWRKTTATGSDTGVYLFPVEDKSWYVVRARAVNPYLNIKSDWTYATLHQVIGKSEPPSDISGLAIDGAVLSWDAVTDIDLAGYVFKFHYGSNVDWGTANALHNGLVTGSPFDLVNLPYASVTIMGKAVDTSGNESVNAATILTNLGDAPVANVVETHSFHPTFAGTLDSCSVSGGQLVAGAADTFFGDDSQSLYGATSSDSFYKPAAGYRQMVYTTDVMTVSSALTGSKITIDIDTQGTDVKIEYAVSGEGSFYGADSEPFYGDDGYGFYVPGPSAFDAITATSFDANNPDSFAVAADSGFNPANPDSFLAVDRSAFTGTSFGSFFGSYSTAWLHWPGQVTAKNADYQFRVTIGSGATQGMISRFTVTIDAPDMVESIADLEISASGTAIPYTKQFSAIKFITFGALQPGFSGAQRLTVNKTNPLVPVVTAVNGSGTAVSGAKVDIYMGGY